MIIQSYNKVPLLTNQECIIISLQRHLKYIEKIRVLLQSYPLNDYALVNVRNNGNQNTRCNILLPFYYNLLR
ncbi:MAG TPA: hypothetical protein VJP58_06425, partial [Candidatus Nitrosocosmicus sp.]|nr:hypothetical protein [Candidatus Nitrosocosmicus sp.]